MQKLKNALSWGFWIKTLSATSGLSEYIIDDRYAPGVGRGFGVNKTLDGKINFGLVKSSPYTNKLVTADEVVTSDWEHYAGTWNGIIMKMYRNGILQTDTENFTPPVDYDAGDLTVGSRVPSSFFNGLIDDVRIYNYARTQKQILEDMNGGRSAIKSPVLDLHFDEGYGETAYDSSIYNNDATLYPGTGGTNTATSAMWTKNGKLGQAIEFDGTDDYVEISEKSELDVGALDPMTVSF